MADIVLINPRFDPSYWGLEYALPFLDAKAVLPVASLPLLAALTPKGHKVTLIDENVEEIDYERCARADIVGVTGMNVQRPRMKTVMTELKRRGIFTVVGGPWATVKEEDFADLADVVFIGEAEETWPLFLTEWAEGRHKMRYEQAEKTDMATVPTPRFDMLPMRKYAFAGVQFSRGCPFTCEFCDIIVVFGRRPRIKTAKQILAELDALLAVGRKSVFIVDDNLIGNKKAIKPILREVIAWQKARGFPMSFATEASVDLAEDPELLQLMVDANIDEVFLGVESPDENALRETKKIQNLSDARGTVLEKIHRIQDAGIEVWCGMIVGFDTDGPGVFEMQRNFIKQSRVIQAMVNVLVAIPHTPLYKRLEREGRLAVGEWANFGTISTNVIPRKISREALCDGYIALMRDIYSPEAFFGRLDALYLDARLKPFGARMRYLSQFPWRKLRYIARLGLEGIAVLTMVLRGVPDPALRREYRRRVLRAFLRRPNPVVLRLYAIKCALHYHAYKFVHEMQASRQLLPEVLEKDEAQPARALAS